MVRPLLCPPHMLRRVAFVVLLAVTTTLSGCAGLFASGYCDSSCEPRPSYSQDDHDYTIPVVVGLTAVIAAVALIARSSDGDRDRGQVAAAQSQATEPPVRFAGTPSEERVDRMFAQGHMLARAGRCDGVQAIGRNLARISYEDFTRYVADPVLAPCYAGAT